MSRITILTPTYNRAEHLPKLYQSLVEQSEKDFDWLVVDDGSTDNTETLVADYIHQAKIPVRYIRQENGGKHRALNTGIAQIATELTFIVDSDDYLPENAIRIIMDYHNKYYKDYQESVGETEKQGLLCGYSFLRCHADGRVNTAYFPENEMIGTYRDVRINGNIAGDKAEVYYTEILKRFPFPTFEGEKFLAEDVVWMQMSGPYQMVHINENVYTCDYLEGGLTRTGHRMKIYSPRGMMLRSRIYLKDPKVCFKIKLKMMLLYQVYGRFAKERMRSLSEDGGNRGLFVACFLPAALLYQKWKKEA